MKTGDDNPAMPGGLGTGLGAVEPSDAELERGIVDAVRNGLGDVARVLAGQLEARQRARSGNVVHLDAAKRRRGA